MGEIHKPVVGATEQRGVPLSLLGCIYKLFREGSWLSMGATT